MIVRIPQRTQTDCAICTVAMLMVALLGETYSYERVLQYSRTYPQVNTDGKFPAWWETYFRDEGLDCRYCAFNGLYSLPAFRGSLVGMLGMKIPRLDMGHIVAVDECGAIDPADNAPDHVSVTEYISSRTPDGVIFPDRWLAVRRPAV
jgi:hypothetical protein